MFCTTFNDLLALNLEASSRYVNALVSLMQSVDTGRPASFADAQEVCHVCLLECRQTMKDLRVHRVDHGC